MSSAARRFDYEATKYSLEYLIMIMKLICGTTKTNQTKQQKIFSKSAIQSNHVVIYSCPDSDFYTLAGQAGSFRTPEMPHTPAEERKRLKGTYGAAQKRGLLFCSCYSGKHQYKEMLRRCSRVYNSHYTERKGDIQEVQLLA